MYAVGMPDQDLKLAKELAAARKSRSYKALYRTWDDFCRAEYGFSGEWGRVLANKAEGK